MTETHAHTPTHIPHTPINNINNKYGYGYGADSLDVLLNGNYQKIHQIVRCRI